MSFSQKSTSVRNTNKQTCFLSKLIHCCIVVFTNCLYVFCFRFFYVMICTTSLLCSAGKRVVPEELQSSSSDSDSDGVEVMNPDEDQDEDEAPPDMLTVSSK